MPNVDLIVERRAYADAVRAAMMKSAEEWVGTPYLMSGNSKDGIDCSHFVYQVLNAARRAASPGWTVQVIDYRNSATIEASGLFYPVSVPEAGDFIMWDGHIGMITDPKEGTFIGAQTSTGVKEASYTTGYWSTKSGKRFVRFVHFF